MSAALSAAPGASTILVARFDHKRDNEVKPSALDLAGELIHFEVDADKDGPLFSPAIYRAGKGRGNAGVEAVTALVLDFDRATEAQFNGVLEGLRARGIDHAWYHTHSHGSTEKPFAARLIVPFAEPVPTPSDKAWKAVWGAAVKDLGATGLVDRSRSDRAGAYYLPRKPAATSPHQAVYVPGKRYAPPVPTTTPRPVAVPAPAAVPAPTAPTAPEASITVDEVRRRLTGCVNNEYAQRVGRGEPPSPPPSLRGPDELDRNSAWLRATGAACLVAPHAPLEIIEAAIRPAWEEEERQAAQAGDDVTPWGKIQTQLVYNHAQAPAKAAEHAAAKERAAATLLAHMKALRATVTIGPAAEEWTRPVVHVDRTDEHLILAELAAALVPSPGLYNWGGLLAEIHGRPGERRLSAIDRDRLPAVISERVQCVAVRGPDARVASVPLPRDLAPAVLKHPWIGRDLRRCVSVVHAPCLLPTGAILASGYDEASGVFVDPSPGLDVPSVPLDPNEADVALARDALDDTLKEFPFETPGDRAAAVALALTLVARPAIEGPTPAWLVTAPVRGTGKTLLVDIAATIATGRPPSGCSWSTDPEEQRKAIFAAARRGEAAIVFNNLKNGSVWGSPTLDGAIDKGEISDRVLGQSQVQAVPVRSVFVGVGNNLQINGDLVRRVIPIRLVPTIENPSTREFERPDPIGYVLENRGRLLWACLVLLRNRWGARGPHVASFGKWSDVVVRAVAAAGLGDALETHRAAGLYQAASLEDGEGAETIELLDIVAAADKGAGVTSKELLQGQTGRQLTALVGTRPGYELRPQDLTVYLNNLRDRIVCGRKLIARSRTKGRNHWQVVSVGRDET